MRPKRPVKPGNRPGHQEPARRGALANFFLRPILKFSEKGEKGAAVFDSTPLIATGAIALILPPLCFLETHITWGRARIHNVHEPRKNGRKGNLQKEKAYIGRMQVRQKDNIMTDGILRLISTPFGRRRRMLVRAGMIWSRRKFPMRTNEMETRLA